ncbi:MAG: type transport system permease protein [Actinomycetota bacterium]|nr:type transport system permease protein [Actinomycetota bacterium]
MASQTVSEAGDRAALARSRAAAQGRIRWELLSLLVRKDLKVKYQGSAIGFAWSLANPLIQMAIYYVIFSKVLDNHIPAYAIYLMAGLLPFSAFSSGVVGASGSVVGSAGLVKKVSFPRLVLPLSAVGFALVQFLLQFVLLLFIVAVSGHDFIGWNLLLIVPAVALLVAFTTSLSILVSAINVRWRDTSHFVEIAMLVWFWANPILYAGGLVKDKLNAHGVFWLYFLNPMATVVSTMQRAIYKEPYYTFQGKAKPLLVDAGYALYVRNLAIGFAISAVLLLLARAVFNRLQADFAEDL